MSNSVNQVTLIGHLGQTPELKETPNTVLTNLSIATNHRVKRGGEYIDETTWHRVTCFGKSAEFICQYARQGTLAYIDGRLQTRTYEKEGETKYITEIIANRVSILAKGKERSEASPVTGQAYLAAKEGFNDDIPF